MAVAALATPPALPSPPQLGAAPQGAACIPAGERPLAAVAASQAAPASVSAAAIVQPAGRPTTKAPPTTRRARIAVPTQSWVGVSANHRARAALSPQPARRQNDRPRRRGSVVPALIDCSSGV